MTRQPTMLDPELGAMRFCKGCDEWWPDDPEFWYSHRKGRGRVCKACQRRWSRVWFESNRTAISAKSAARWQEHKRRCNKRNHGLCVVGECPVSTPRDRCYFHARVLVA